MRDVGREADRAEHACVGARHESVERRVVPACDRLRDQRRIGALPRQRRADPAREVAVLERRCAVGPRTDDQQVELVHSGQRIKHRFEVEQACDQHMPGVEGRGNDRRGAVGRREHELIAAGRHRLAGRVALVEPRRGDAALLAGDDAPRGSKAGRVLHAVDADHAPIPGRQRLRDRRRGAKHVDHDRDIRRAQLTAGEGDIDHAAPR
jgi:hypothetical protein